VGTVMSSMGIQYVFVSFATILIVGAIITVLFAVETKDRVLEELSP
ncbi:MAG: MFS transporter, partial [Rhizobium leguminosarum]